MAHIDVRSEVELNEPTLVEGFPGVGLVGKIAADHLVTEFDMVHYANVHCDSLPAFASYESDDSTLRTPVRLYAGPERDILVLQSDVPVSPEAATEFADCVQDWFIEEGVTPIYLSGVPREDETEVPSLYGIAAGDGQTLLGAIEVDTPPEAGIISGPTGALLNHAIETGLTAVGLVVDADPRFPDPAAAKILIENGIEPLVGVDASVDTLVEQSERVREAKERLAEQLQAQQEKSTQARPLRMYQ